MREFFVFHSLDRIYRIYWIFFTASSLRLVEPTPRRDEAEKTQPRFIGKKGQGVNNLYFLHWITVFLAQ
jgi:hypothetical protein